MKSIRKALRDGEITKDNYGRLKCSQCDLATTRRADPDGVGSIRTCPDCGRKWHQLTA